MLSHPVFGPIAWYVISLGGLFGVTLLAALLLKYCRHRWYRLSFTLLALFCIGLNLNKTVTILNDLARSTYVNSRDIRIELDREELLSLQTKARQGDQLSVPKLALLKQEMSEQPEPSIFDKVGAVFFATILTLFATLFLPVPVFSLGFGLTALAWGAITPEAKLVDNSPHARLFRSLWHTGSSDGLNICRLSWNLGFFGWLQLMSCCAIFTALSLWQAARTVYYLVVFAELRNPVRAVLDQLYEDSGEGVIIGRLSLFGIHPSPLLCGLIGAVIWLATQYLTAPFLYWPLGVVGCLLLVDVLLWRLIGKKPIAQFRPFTTDSSLVAMVVIETIDGVKTIGHEKRSHWFNFWQSLHQVICPRLTSED